MDARSALARLLPDADQDWIAASGCGTGAARGRIGGPAGCRGDWSRHEPAALHAAARRARHRDVRPGGDAAREPRRLRETRAAAGGPAGAARRRRGVAGRTRHVVPQLFRDVEPRHPPLPLRHGHPARRAAPLRQREVACSGSSAPAAPAWSTSPPTWRSIPRWPSRRCRRCAAQYAERLRREARAMASVLHPNLATIYGAEEWHDTPLLIVEYLEGGTLLDWLARGAMPVDETLDLGIMLADVLDRVHGSACCIATSSRATSATRSTACRSCSTSGSPPCSTGRRGPMRPPP